MNKSYRLIWSEITQSWAVVAENVKARGKRSGTTVAAKCFRLSPLVAALALLPAAAFAAPAPLTLPVGGQLVAGQAVISQTGATLNIDQTSSRAAIDWQTFNIGSAATVNFKQPGSSSAILNRVLDSNPSQIFGHLTSNGQVFLSNASGIYFAPGATANVGALTATTHNISNSDFMAGIYKFLRMGASGSVINEGQLTASLDGYIALLAPEVRNNGVIIARTVALAAAESYELAFDANNTLVNIRVTPSEIAALVENGNAVHAPNGLIILSAQAANRLQGGVVNNSGTLEATGLVNNGGVIRLEASDRITHSGSINVDASPNGNGGRATLIADLSNPASITQLDGSISARGGNQGGDGGFVETSGSHVKVGDNSRVDARAVNGHMGSWLLDPTDYTIAASGGDETGQHVSDSMTANRTISVADNININDAISWNANLLTLQTTSGDININAVLTANNSATLDLEPGSTRVNVGMNDNASFKGRVDFFQADGVTRRKGDGYLTMNGIGYRLITELTDPTLTAGNEQTSLTGNDLQGINGNLTGHYALNANIDASATAGWNSGSGFKPIGGDAPPSAGNFSGAFDGLGHTISNMTISQLGTLYVGLFGTTNGATLRNAGLLGASVNSEYYVGSLVGSAYNSTVYNSFSTGTVAGYADVGGLIGHASFSTIDNSYATGNVIGSSGADVGGLVGMSYGSKISNSHATSKVVGVNSTIVGGLVGYSANGGTISNSYATGSVSGNNYVGGLVGNAGGTHIINSYATGNVNGGSYVGGLVGEMGMFTFAGNTHATGNVTGSGSSVGGLIGKVNYGSISNSYATGQVSGPVSGAAYTGGLVGMDIGYISDSNATGSVSGSAYTGGLVGAGFAGISNSYATGAVSGITDTGGLVGRLMSSRYIDGYVTNSHATGDVTGSSYQAGGLVGSTYKTSISDSYATGQVSSTDCTGGLIGNNLGNISHSYATGNVTSGGYSTGGLAGTSDQGNISDSYATGNVSGKYNTGGLVGSNYGSVSNSYASGQVSGTNYTGGLIGVHYNGDISHSYATGDVTGSNDSTGGLVGSNFKGSISYSHANGQVAGINNTGGLIGSDDGNISFSYATGAVNGTSDSGGLVGTLLGSSSIDNSYARGDVTANGFGLTLGGLVGLMANELNVISNSYATGKITDKTIFGALQLGGLVGANAGSGTVSNSFYDSDINPTLSGISGMTDVPGKVWGMTTLAMKNVNNFNSATGTSSLGDHSGNGNFNPNWDLGTPVWAVKPGGANDGYPCLEGLSCFMPVYLRLITGSSLYGDTPTLTYRYYSAGGYEVTDALPSGTVSWSGAPGATSNVNTYSVTYSSGITSGNADYTIAAGSAVDWVITPRTLNLSATKNYDGKNSFSTGFAPLGMVNGDTAPIVSGSATVSSANVGNYNSFTSNTLALDNGNYTLSGATITATIDKAHLTVTANDASRAYGAANPTLSSVVSGFVNGETEATAAGYTGTSSASTGANGTTPAGTAVITAGAGTLLADNYDFTNLVNGTLTINRAVLSLSGTRAYDGTTRVAAPLFTLSGLANGEQLTLNGSGTVPSKNAGSYTVTQGSLALADGTGLAANYTLSGGTLTATIGKAVLSVTANAASKTYDGGLAAPATAQVGALANVTDVVYSAGSEAFLDKNVGVNKTVHASGVIIHDAGNADVSGNYDISYIDNTSSSIKQLASVSWIGGNGNWSNPGNWANGAIPDYANVATVNIPSGKTVTYDSGVAGATSLKSLNSSSNLIMAGGSLSTTGNFSTAGYQQSGGQLNVGGVLSIASSKNGVVLGNINAASLNISSKGGDISQLAASVLNVSGASVLTAGGSGENSNKNSFNINLTNAGNIFAGLVTASANTISLFDSIALSVILDSNGASTLGAVGALNVAGKVGTALTTTTTGGAKSTTTFGNTTVGTTLKVTSSGAVSKVSRTSVLKVHNSDTTKSNANVSVNGRIAAIQ